MTAVAATAMTAATSTRENTMTITQLHPNRLDREPTDADLYPHIGPDDICSYCGCFQTDDQAENRAPEHIVRDLLAIHRVNEGLKGSFGIDHPGYDADVYDLLCELDNAQRRTTIVASALAGTAVAR